MIATSTVVMFGLMYSNRRANFGILAGSAAVFAGALWLVRSQERVDDDSDMKAVIPHHSIAIMTSERAHIRDPRVRLIVDRIIDALNQLGPAAGGACTNDKDDWAYYGRIGADAQRGSFVVGVIGEFGTINITDGVTGFSSTPASYVFNRDIAWEAGIRGRAGYTPNSTTLFYGAAGPGYARIDRAFGSTNTNNTFTAAASGTSSGSRAAAVSSSASVATCRSGWSICTISIVTTTMSFRPVGQRELPSP